MSRCLLTPVEEKAPESVALKPFPPAAPRVGKNGIVLDESNPAHADIKGALMLRHGSTVSP